MNSLSYRGFLMSLAGWTTAALLIVCAFVLYYIIYYPDFLLSFENNQFYELTSGVDSDNSCVKYELVVPKYIAPFDEYQLTFRVNNEQTYTSEGVKKDCPTIDNYFRVRGEMVTQIAEFNSEADNKLMITPTVEPLSEEKKIPSGLNYFKPSGNNKWYVSFSAPLEVADNGRLERSSSVEPFIRVKVPPGTIAEIPITLHVTSVPKDFEANLWNFVFVKYEMWVVPWVQNAGSQGNESQKEKKQGGGSENKNQSPQGQGETVLKETKISFGNAGNSCVTQKFKTALPIDDEAKISSWFEELMENDNDDGDVKDPDKANQWPCSELNYLLAFRQTAIQRMLLSPFSNTLIPLIVLAIVYFLDGALPTRSEEYFFPRLSTLLLSGIPMLYYVFNELSNTFIKNSYLGTSDIFYTLGSVFIVLAVCRVIVVPCLWAVLRYVAFCGIGAFQPFRRLTEQELSDFWEDVHPFIFTRCLARSAIANMLLVYAREIQTGDNAFLKERQRRLYEKILQIDPDCVVARFAVYSEGNNAPVWGKSWLWGIYDWYVGYRGRKSKSTVNNAGKNSS